MTEKELYDNISRGGEIEFDYENKHYSITHIEQGIDVMESYNYDTEKIYLKSEEVGEYIIQGKKLKDILSDIVITFRCF